MASITILAVLSTLAIPAMGNLYNRNQTKAAAILFQDNLRQARYESKTQSNASVTFCAVKMSYARKTECVTNNNKRRFENGWQWFIDINSNGTYEKSNGDIMLGNTYESHDNDIDILVSDRILNNSIRYTGGRSTILSSGSDPITPFVTFTDNKGGANTVYFDQTGRSSIKH